MASLLTGKELEQLGSFTGRFYSSHCNTVVKSKFNYSFHCRGMFLSFIFSYVLFWRSSKWKWSHFSHLKLLNKRIDISQSHFKVNGSGRQEAKHRVHNTEVTHSSFQKPQHTKQNLNYASFNWKLPSDFRAQRQISITRLAPQLSSCWPRAHSTHISKARLDTRGLAAYKQGQNMTCRMIIRSN